MTNSFWLNFIIILGWVVALLAAAAGMTLLVAYVPWVALAVGIAAALAVIGALAWEESR